MSGTTYRVCPRCGLPIDFLERKVVRRKGKDGKVREQVYLYAWHYLRGPDGRRQIKRCYLGPEKYVHANRLLATAGLHVKSLAQQLMEDRPLVVSQLEELAKAIEEKMARTEISTYTAQQLADRLQGLADRLRKYAEEKAKEEAEGEGKAEEKAGADAKGEGEARAAPAPAGPLTAEDIDRELRELLGTLKGELRRAQATR